MKKIVSILLTLAVTISLLVIPAVVSAADPLPYTQTFGPVEASNPGDSVTATSGEPNTTDVTIEDTGDGWLKWTYTYPTSGFQPKMTVAINYPDGYCITTFDDGSHTGWYYAPDPDVEATRVQFATDINTGGSYLDWAQAGGIGDHNSGPSELWVKIKKSALNLTTKWHGYANVNGNQVRIETEAYQPVGEVTFVPDQDVSLDANIDEITAINVYPSNVDFGTITPGTTVSGVPDPITVTNIGTVTVDVGVNLDPPGGVFQYLFLNGRNRTGGSWSAGDLGMVDILPSLSRECTTELQVPATYSAKGEELATLIFEVATA